MPLRFEQFAACLRKPLESCSIPGLFDGPTVKVERSAYMGFVEFQAHGVEMILKEAPWVIPAAQITDPSTLYVAAFHFHSRGYEGYQQYSGDFPLGLAFGDDEKAVRAKLGQSIVAGGGNFSPTLGKRISPWLRTDYAGALLQAQFNDNGRVDQITLSVEDLQQKAARSRS
jgi:hypothetical protein